MRLGSNVNSKKKCLLHVHTVSVHYYLGFELQREIKK